MFGFKGKFLLLRIGILLLIVILSISSFLLAGCKQLNNNETYKQEPIAKDEVVKEEAIKEGVVQKETDGYTLPIGDGNTTLVIAGRDSFLTDQSYTDGFPVIQEIEKITGVKIQWEVFPANQVNMNLQTRLASGQNLPDIMELPGSVGDAVKYAKDGLILPLNDLISSYAPNIMKLYTEHPSIRRGSYAPDGDIYFLPNYLLGLKNGISFIIRNDWLKKVGKQIPETVDDWFDVLMAFKNNDVNGNGAGDVIPFGGDVSYFGSGFGLVSPVSKHYYYDDNNKIFFFATTEKYRNYLEYVKKLFDNKLLDPMFGSGQSKISDLQKQNKVAVLTGYAGSVEIHDTTLKSLGFTEADHTYVLPPKDSNGNRKLDVLNECRNTSRYAITKDCKDPELAIKFLDFVYASEQGTRLLNCGFEGKHYEIVNGKLEFKDEVINNERYDFNTVLRMEGALNAFMDYQTAEMNNARLYGKFKEAVDTINDGNCAVSFPVMIPSLIEQDRIVALSNNIYTYINENTVNFITGRRSLSEFDDFVNELKGMGIDELTQIYQNQYDKYLKN